MSVLTTEPKVRVVVKSLEDIFEEDSNLPLKIDSYQRPYVWDQSKVAQLCQDLVNFQKGSESTGKSYYMGSLLIHTNQEDQAQFVIDGQQRLTSLGLLALVLRGSKPKNLDFEYSSEISERNVSSAYQTILKVFEDSDLTHLLSQIQFTVIAVDDLDLAFTFFDTQNNRGVPLAATDILKAYHLRHIATSQKEIIQEHTAKRWESIQRLNGKDDYISELFDQYLWKARNWKGNGFVVWHTNDHILKTFQTESLVAEVTSQVPLYPAASNRWAEKIIFTEGNSFQVIPRPLDLENDPMKLPFAIRQPIHCGVGFFLYTEKYARMLYDLKDSGLQGSKTRVLFHRFYEGLVKNSNLSWYFQNLFWTAVLVYFDRFGEDQLLHFAHALDYVLGAFRLDQQSIVKQTPVKILRDHNQNLLDVINGAFIPNEVIGHLYERNDCSAVYSSSGLEELSEDTGVRGKYYRAAREYYGREDWSNRVDWSKGIENEL
jgi:hypothetical protein